MKSRSLKRSCLGIASVATLVLGTACSVVGINTVEEASYRMLQEDGKFELREYAPLLVAETTVDADFKDAGNTAFRRLFGYISGDNESKQKIAMTAPVVADSSKGEKIEMTAPVIGEPDGDRWRYRFVLPASYSLETAPAPLNDSVRLTAVPKKKVAVLRFSGRVNKVVIDEKSAQLSRWMKANNLDMASEPRWAGYNPPWTIPFLRRNEVMIDVIE
jgi:hypothetical protein